MDERELRQIFLEKLHVEINLFKDTMLNKSKADIYAGSYMIEVYVNLYDILVAETERMQEPLLRKLLYQNFGILDTLYVEWLNQDDSFYAELRDYVENEIEVLAVNGIDNGKDDGYENKYDKAA